MNECKDNWHLSYEELTAKYGDKEIAEDFYNPARTCPSCGAKSIPGD